MTENTTDTRRKRSTGARVALLVGAALAGVLAIGALGLGALAFWGEDQKDDQGYLSTDSQPFATGTHALATENLDVDLDGADSLVDSTGLGDVRLDVEPRSDKALFVGIARTDDVTRYLADVSHTTVTDIDYSPFKASYSRQSGEGRPAAPGDERIWAASAQGNGPQTLTWDAEDGNWSVVVMNADGSPGVRADISAGAKLPFLTEIGWSALGGGTLLLLATTALIVFAFRPPRPPRRPTPNPDVAPSAS